MNREQLRRMKEDPGFIAALDQSGGSTPGALERYGVKKDAWNTEEEMFDLIHQMRTRIITSPAFTKDHILGAILFEKTMESVIDGKETATYLWEEKGIVPILKVDEGLAPLEEGVQLMKPITKLEERLEKGKKYGIFGTKMRSVIHENNRAGIEKIVAQQFDLGARIFEKGFVPILEPEVDIHGEEKAAMEETLHEFLVAALEKAPKDHIYMFKLTLPEKENLYEDLYDYPQTLRVVALSGGYSQEEANRRLEKNHRVIASFSRGLTETLSVDQSKEEFDEALKKAILAIAEGSNT